MDHKDYLTHLEDVRENLVKALNTIDSFINEEEEYPELPTQLDTLVPRVGIIVGHTKKAQGAVSQCGVTEYVYNSEIAERMLHFNAKDKIQFFKIFRDGVGIAGAYRKCIQLKCDAVIELHFNAFNGHATGTETLCSTNKDDISFAEMVQDEIVLELGLKDRYVKSIPRSGRGGVNVYSFPTGVNCLVEPGFGDNADDFRVMQNKKEEYAEALYKACEEWFNVF